MRNKGDTFSLKEVLERYLRNPIFNNQLEMSVDSLAMDGDSVLHKAVAASDLEAVVLLIDGGANPNIKGDMGCTPLHEAVEKGNRDIVEILVRSGASANIVSEFGETPIDVAFKGGRTDLVSILNNGT